jgi:hypothetical protein
VHKTQGSNPAPQKVVVTRMVMMGQMKKLRLRAVTNLPQATHLNMLVLQMHLCLQLKCFTQQKVH